MTVKKNPVSTQSGSEPGAARRSTAIAPFEEMDRMFDAFFSPRWPRLARWGWPEAMSRMEAKMPAVDLIDRNDQLVVRAEIPGVKKEDIDISVAGNMVTLRARTQHEEQKEEGEYYRREISRGEFSRTLTLPAEVDSTKAKASFKDGVLELILPKLEPTQRRTIKVE